MRSVTSRLIEAWAGAGRGVIFGVTETTFSGAERGAGAGTSAAVGAFGDAKAPVMRWNRFGARAPASLVARTAAVGRACSVLRTGALVRDSVGLSTTARERNIAGGVRLTGPVPRGEILLFDDILTTGATAREAVRMLTAGGGEVSAVLTLAH